MSILGLNENEMSMLSDSTTRLMQAIAALRDAWMRSDPSNAHALEVAIAVLFHESHSMHRNQSIARKVLAHGHDRWDELFTNVSCALLDLGAMEQRLKKIIANAQAIGNETGLGFEKEIAADGEACLTIFREAAEIAMEPNTPTSTRVNNHPTAKEILEVLSPIGHMPTDAELAPKNETQSAIAQAVIDETHKRSR